MSRRCSREWTRALDDTSTARIVVNPDGDCCERLGQVRAWRHYLNIWRDGAPVWSGPILQAEWSRGQMEVWAADVLAVLDRRVPHDDIRFGDTDLVNVATWLISDGFAPDDPGHSIEVLGKTGVRGGREYQRNIGQTGDHLRDLAKVNGLQAPYTIYPGQELDLPERSSGQLVPPYPGRSAFVLGRRHQAVTELDRQLVRLRFARHHDGNG